MNNTTMIEKVTEIATYLGKDDTDMYNYVLAERGDLSMLGGVPALLAELVKQLREDVRREEAKKSGRNTQLSAAKRILKAVPDTRPAMKLPAIQDGKQCFCDGYRAVRLVNPLPFPERPEDLGDFIDLSKIIMMPDHATEMELPSISELSAYIKTYKAEHKKSKDPARFDFGADSKIVNAQFLLDMMSIMPDAKAYENKNNKFSGIYFVDDEGNDGILLPVRPDDDEIRGRTEL